MLRTNVTSEKSAKNIKKGKIEKIAQASRTGSSTRSFFRSESVHVAISFFCERVATLRWHSTMAERETLYVRRSPFLAKKILLAPHPYLAKNKSACFPFLFSTCLKTKDRKIPFFGYCASFRFHFEKNFAWIVM